MTAALEVKGITKSYGAIQVARDITIALQEGERHALIGPNGAGKTTLVNILSGTVTPNSGTILSSDTTSRRIPPQSARGRVWYGHFKLATCSRN